MNIILILLVVNVVKADIGEKLRQQRLRQGQKVPSVEYNLGLSDTPLRETKDDPLCGQLKDPLEKAICRGRASVFVSGAAEGEKGAAATNVQVIKNPEGQDNLDRLCSDPFHSFLCKPTGKRRQRIGGELRPQAVIPQAILNQQGSHISESRLRPQPSNDFNTRVKPFSGDEYLPPPLSSPRPLPSTTTTVAPTTQKIQKVDPAPTRTEPVYDRSKQDCDGPNRGIGCKPIPKLPNSYLPPPSKEDENLQPASAQNTQTILKPNSKHDDEDNLERLCNDPFHSFLCKPITKMRQRLDGSIRPQAKLPPGFKLIQANDNSGDKLRPFPSNQKESYSRLDDQKFQNLSPLPSNVQNAIALPSTSKPMPSGYTYSKPGNQGYTYPKPVGGQIFNTTRKPEPSFKPLSSHNQNSYSSFPTNKPATNVYSYPKPTTAKPNQQETKPSRYPSVPVSTSKPSTGYVYNKPSSTISYQSTIRPNTNLNSQPSNNQNTFSVPKNTGYNYPKPSITYTPQTMITKPIVGQNILPSNTQSAFATLTTKKPVTGYAYSVPSSAYSYLTTTKHPIPNLNPQASDNRNSFASTSNPTNNGYNYPKPKITTQRPVPKLNPLPSANQNSFAASSTVKPFDNGYNYPKPSKTFEYPTTKRPANHSPLPSNNQNVFVSLPTVKPASNGYNYPKPTSTYSYVTSTKTPPINLNNFGTNQQNSFSKTPSGYSYPKPSTGSTYTSTTRKPSVINFNPQPSNTQNSFASSPSPKPANTGYDYPKPSNPFVYPTTIRPPAYSLGTLPSNKQNSYATTPRPKPATEGYNYQKPSNKFQLPKTTERSSINLNPLASNTQNAFAKLPTSNGYNYSKPPNGFSFTTTKRPIQTINTLPSNNQMSFISTSKPISTGYAYPKPSKSFTLPTTTARPVQNLNPQPSNNRDSIVNSPTRKPASTGYNYPRPSSTLSYPTTTRIPVSPLNTLPSNNQNSFVSTTGKPAKGYDYPKPSKGFDYPTTTKRIPVALTGQASQDSPKQSGGYVYTSPPPEKAFTLPQSFVRMLQADSNSPVSNTQTKDTHAQVSRLGQILSKYNAQPLKTSEKIDINFSLPLDGQFEIIRK